MKKIKLFALAAFAMLSTNAFAAVGSTFLGSNGIRYQITKEYVAAAAGVDEQLGTVTIINYGLSTTTDAVTIPEIVGNLDATNTDVPTTNRYKVVGINGTETTAVTVNDIAVNTTAATQAFKNAKSTSITLPTSILYIGKGAFEGCEAATIVIPAGSQLYQIDDQAFKGASKLATFNTANATWLTKIGMEAFAGCTQLSTMSLSSKLESIGIGAFKGTKIASLDLSACTSFNTAKGASIGRWFTDGTLTYAANATLTTVVLPALTGANVIAIDMNAFLGCTALKTIGATANAFTIPATVSAIGEGAFKLTAVTKLDLSASPITAVGDWFTVKSATNTPTLQQIVLKNNVAYTAFDVDGISTLAKIGMADAEYALPATTTAGAIEAGMFAGTALEQLNLSKITTAIETLPAIFGADGISSLTTVVLNNQTANIAPNAFANCTALASLTIAKADGTAVDGLTTIANVGPGAFYRTALASLTFGAPLTVLEQPFFGTKTDGTGKALPASQATSISVDLSKAVNLGKYDAYTYDVTISAAEYDALEAGDYKDLFASDDNGTATFIGIETIDKATYDALDAAAKALYTSNDDNTYTKTIDAVAYDGLDEAEKADYEGNDEDGYTKTIDKADYDALDAGDQADYVDNEDQTYTYNSTAQISKGDYDGLAAAAQELYVDDENLTYTATVPVAANANACIGNGAFKNVAALTSIVLPESLVIIGESAFEGTGLTTLDLPKNIAQVADGGETANRGIKAKAFKDCKSLKTMNFSPDEENGSIFANKDNVFSGCSLVSIYVTETYKTAAGDAPTNSKYVGGSPEEVTTVKDKVRNYAMKGFYAANAYQFDSEECGAYEAYTDGDNIVMSPLRKRDGKYNVPANTAVIIRTAEATTIKPKKITIDGDHPTSMVFGGENCLKSVAEKTNREEVPGFGNYMYVLVNNATAGFSFQYFTGTAINKGNIYVIYGKEPVAAGRMNIVWLDENGNVESDATAIKAIEAAEAENGAIYNLQGVRVSTAKKGLYIKNGKKYLVK